MLFEVNDISRAAGEARKSLALFGLARDAAEIQLIAIPWDSEFHRGAGIDPMDLGPQGEFMRAEALARAVLGVALTSECINGPTRYRYQRSGALLGTSPSVSTADDHLNRAVSMDPWNAEVLCARADLRLNCKDIPGALRDLKESCAQAPSLLEAYIMRASIFIDDTGDLKSAAAAAKGAHARTLICEAAPNYNVIQLP